MIDQGDSFFYGEGFEVRRSAEFLGFLLKAIKFNGLYRHFVFNSQLIHISCEELCG